jgi:hypothetical protein
MFTVCQTIYYAIYIFSPLTCKVSNLKSTFVQRFQNNKVVWEMMDL